MVERVDGEAWASTCAVCGGELNRIFSVSGPIFLCAECGWTDRYESVADFALALWVRLKMTHCALNDMTALFHRGNESMSTVRRATAALRLNAECHPGLPRYAAFVERQPPARPVVVCLCGSCRFKEAYIDAQARETDAGKIVLTVGRFMSQEEQAVSPGLKARLDELHLRKIEMADEILVLNVGGYLGDSTRTEIEHARRLGKRIRWLNPPVEAKQ